MAKPIKERESINRDRDRDFGSKFNVIPGLPTYYRSDVSLIKADDPVGDSSALGVAENCLLTHQPADYQQLFIPVPSSCQKAAATSS